MVTLEDGEVSRIKYKGIETANELFEKFGNIPCTIQISALEKNKCEMLVGECVVEPYWSVPYKGITLTIDNDLKIHFTHES